MIATQLKKKTVAKITISYLLFAIGLLLFSSFQQPYVGEISQKELMSRMEKNDIPLILDVRSPEEFERGHIEGAVNITDAELPYSLKEIDQYKNQEIVVYCRSGRRAKIAAEILRQNGFQKILLLEGHMIDWIQKNLPLVTD